MPTIEKAATGNKFEFVLSDETRDSYGDIVMANGWDLTRFDTNPMALWDHGHDPEIGRKPIGRWTNVRVVKGRLLGTLDPARGVSDSIDEIIALHELGFLPAVSVGFEPIESEPVDPKSPYAGTRYLKQRLLETSIVAIGANPAAIQLAKSHNISDRTLSRVFGEHAETRRRDVTATGEHAEMTSPDPKRSRVDLGAKGTKTMKTISQRLEEAQNRHAAKEQRRVDLTNAEELDHDAIVKVNGEIETLARDIEVLKASEASIAKGAGPSTPAAVRRPLGFPQAEVKPADLIVRAAVCHLLANVSGRSIERVLEDRYPGHEATAAVTNIVTKTTIVPATTTTSGWASQLVEIAMAEFLALLPPTSVYPVLRSMGVGLTFGPNSGAIKIPFSSTTAALAGGFVLEGDPIPVGRLTLDSVTLTPHKFGIIVPMTREVMRYTNPALEAIVRSELLARTAITLDGILLDATVGSTTRPPGLRYGVAAAGLAYGGADYTAFLEDMKTILSPFDAANAGRSLAVLMNPAQARNIRMMPGPNNSGFGWANQFLADFRVVVSTSVTAGMVIAVDTADFVTGTGDSPNFEASEQATLHMSDTPGAIVSGSTPADVVRSMFQTNTVALRMLMDVTWAMRRSGMVQWIQSVTW